mmetsp:Transcript_5812/g.7553  ORF Transcript_5812/g.7553 Transcript_5812/m.7553 type:complete len:1102 (-) Transcript_5812:86-3391(-)
MSWSISVRTVGGGDNGNNNSNSVPNERNGGGEGGKSIQSNVSNFTVEVEPDDFLSSLHDKIEGVTGLTAAQQRLIYRGRIISGGGSGGGRREGETDALATTTAASSSSSSSSSEGQKEQKESRIRDVDGLCDGQTIHLVPRPNGSSSSSSGNDGSSSGGDNSESLGAAAGSTSGSGGASLLAALLGLGGGFSLGSTDDDDDDDGGDTATNNPASEFGRFASLSAASTGRRSQQRGARGGSSSRRRGRDTYSARLTEADLQVPDPGSLEPVRQGLLTLHTMLHNTERPLTQPLPRRTQSPRNNATSLPLEADRRWFRGQWLDCRDTVNQWLEATIVDIVTPNDILPPHQTQQQTSLTSDEGNAPNNRPRRQPATDPAVGANDFIGRRRLLLEPRRQSNGDIILTPTTNSTVPSALTEEEDDEFERYCPRENNDGVQLLLIHYNGWPHRWDEWIRSDSERIRPFRTRTRHRASAFNASPTPQSVFQAAPNTYINDEDDDEMERAAMLPELSRTLSAINALLSDTIDSSNGARGTHIVRSSSSSHLPWLSHDEEESMEEDEEETTATTTATQQGTTDTMSEQLLRADTIAPNMHRSRHRRRINSCTNNIKYDRKKLEALTPLIDRLGRTLTDAAPHIAALAALSPESAEEENEEEVEREQGQNDTVSSEETAATASRIFWRSSRSATPAEGSSPSTTPLLSSIGGDGRNSENEGEEDRSNDPDFVDFINGMVNVSREGGGGRSSRLGGGSASRSRVQDGSDGLGTSLLATYLAAAGLGSLGGGGSGGGGSGGGGGDNGAEANRDGSTTDNTANTLGQLVRIGGGTGGGNGGSGNGAGIDIHIHAIVTGPNMPGVGAGALGLATMGGVTQPPTNAAAAAALSDALGNGSGGNSERNSTNDSAVGPISDSSLAATAISNDDDGLFSQLYSEDPSSINLHGSSHNSNVQSDGDNNDKDADVVESIAESLDDPPLVNESDEEENFKDVAEEDDEVMEEDVGLEDDDVPPLINDSAVVCIEDNNSAMSSVAESNNTSSGAGQEPISAGPSNAIDINMAEAVNTRSSSNSSTSLSRDSSSSRRGSSFTRILRRALGSRRSSSNNNFGGSR